MKNLTPLLLLVFCTVSNAQLGGLLKDLNSLKKNLVDSTDSSKPNAEIKSNNTDLPVQNKGFSYVDRIPKNDPTDCSQYIDDPSKSNSTTFQPRSKFTKNDFDNSAGDGDKSKIDANGNLAGTQIKNVGATTFNLTSNGRNFGSVQVRPHNLVHMISPDWSVGGVDMNIDASHISLQNCPIAKIERLDDFESIAISCYDQQVPAFRQFQFLRNNRNGTMILESQRFRTCGPKTLIPNSEFYKQLTSRFSCHDKQLLEKRTSTFEKLTFKNKSTDEIIEVRASINEDKSFPNCGNDGHVTFDLSNPNNSSRFKLVNQVMDKSASGQKKSTF